MLKLSCGHYADDDYYLVEAEIRFNEELESVTNGTFCKECMFQWEDNPDCKVVNVQLIEFG